VTVGEVGIGVSRDPVWVFSGQGSQWPGMGRVLLDREPAFGRALAGVDAVIEAEAGFSVLEIVRRGKPVTGCARVQPVLLPGAVYALSSRRYPDARAMIAAGLAIVLATDFNPGSSPTPSLPMILSLAVIRSPSFAKTFERPKSTTLGQMRPAGPIDSTILDGLMSR